MGTREISNLIEETALELLPDIHYLRATDQEANISADNIDLANKTFVLYNNRPTISGGLFQNSGLVVETIPTEISFLRLADFDDNDIDTDLRISGLTDYARVMFASLSNEVTLAEYVEGYEISLGDDETKIYDKTMSGVKLTFDLVMQRGICELDLGLDEIPIVDADFANLIDDDFEELVDEIDTFEPE